MIIQAKQSVQVPPHWAAPRAKHLSRFFAPNRPVQGVTKTMVQWNGSGVSNVVIVLDGAISSTAAKTVAGLLLGLVLAPSQDSAKSQRAVVTGTTVTPLRA
jgi:hypothetical protein